MKWSQSDLFGDKKMSTDEIMSHWAGMPEYDNKKEEEPEVTVVFKFRTVADFDEFNDLIKKYVYKTRKVFDGMQGKTEKRAWYPLKEKASKYEYVE